MRYTDWQSSVDHAIRRAELEQAAAYDKDAAHEWALASDWLARTVARARREQAEEAEQE